MTVYKLRLHKTYYSQGFFNVPVDFDHLVRKDNGQIEISLAGISIVEGYVNRNANLNGTARVMGRTILRDWFQNNFKEMDEVFVEFISSTHIRINRVDPQQSIHFDNVRSKNTSPFPGMNPYLEVPEIWDDFYLNLASEIQAILNPAIRPRYVARLNSRVTYEVIEIARTRGVRPDVAVWQPQPPKSELGGTTFAIAPAPVESEVSLDIPLRLVSIEIRQTDSLELVTAIEILSPVNKRPGHEAYSDYLRKRRELLRSTAHLIEIDLLRGGNRPPLETDVPEAPYYVTLSREERRPKVEVWPIHLGEKLPVLPIPLLAPDPDAPLDLAAAVAAVYEKGGYADLIDYRQPPPPPELGTAERDLLGEILVQAGYR